MRWRGGMGGGGQGRDGSGPLTKSLFTLASASPQEWPEQNLRPFCSSADHGAGTGGGGGGAWKVRGRVTDGGRPLPAVSAASGSVPTLPLRHSAQRQHGAQYSQQLPGHAHPHGQVQPALRGGRAHQPQDGVGPQPYTPLCLSPRLPWPAPSLPGRPTLGTVELGCPVGLLGAGGGGVSGQSEAGNKSDALRWSRCAAVVLARVRPCPEVEVVTFLGS